ncbi:MAG TPA: peptide ABC transporter substrate-binding protein [Gemmatimonadaceae bacterium]
MRQHTLLATLFLALAACSRGERAAPGGENGGTLVVSVGADADAIIPPVTSNVTSVQIGSLVFEHLAEPGALINAIGDAGWKPKLARSWSWAPDSLSITFHIDPRAHWHDGRPVRASDVRFTWQLYIDPRTGSDVAPLLANIDSVTAPDSTTVTFWFAHRKPDEFFDAAFQMRILPEHLLTGVPRDQLQSSEFARHPVGSGPYRFVRWVPRQSIELVADTAYHLGRPHIDRLIWSIAADPNAALLRVMSGEADFIEYLRPSDLAEVAKHPELKAVRYPSMAYAYLLFNERDPDAPSRPHPVFGDRAVRRALTMAVDRAALVRSVFDTLAVPSIGPITHAVASYDSTVVQIPFAPDSARALLDAAGWRDTDGDGIRQKAGRPLRFTINVPSSSTPRMRMAVLLQQMFRSVGARADIDQMDFPTHSQRVAARQFDATINAMVSDGNPATVRQNWSIPAARAKDGGNAGSYESPTFDALIDTASTQMNPAAARAYYHRAYQVLIDDAPAIWLYEPVSFSAMHRRIHPVAIRPDMWWANLDQWYIPAAERIPRDRIGLADARP